jgi:hypothetical protein
VAANHVGMDFTTFCLMGKATTAKALHVNSGQCSILKSSTPAKYHFGYQKSFLIFGHFTKMCSAKFSLVIMKASLESVCHKIKWLQFANKNIGGLQSWHSSRHFQIPITPTTSTRH